MIGNFESIHFLDYATRTYPKSERIREVRSNFVLFLFNNTFFARNGLLTSYALFLSQSLGRMLDARQLGLKLIANVTFGYTSAHYSGRMPCVEVRQVKIVIGKGYISAACVKQNVWVGEREREGGVGGGGIGGEFSC